MSANNQKKVTTSEAITCGTTRVCIFLFYNRGLSTVMTFVWRKEQKNQPKAPWNHTTFRSTTKSYRIARMQASQFLYVFAFPFSNCHHHPHRHQNRAKGDVHTGTYIWRWLHRKIRRPEAHEGPPLDKTTNRIEWWKRNSARSSSAAQGLKMNAQPKRAQAQNY